MKNWLRLLISIAIPQLVGAMGAYFTITETGSWFQTIEKPPWQPPNWLFGPSWTTLYLMMGVAFYLVWKSEATLHKKRPAMILWIAQLILNFGWTILFFNQHKIGWALIEIICLWLLILLNIFFFARINKWAAWLLVPYISWVSFAALLTYAIWKLN